jgi:hypothetical protein
MTIEFWGFDRFCEFFSAGSENLFLFFFVVIEDFGEGVGFDLEEAFVGVVKEVDEHEVEDDNNGEQDDFDKVSPVVDGFE